MGEGLEVQRFLHGGEQEEETASPAVLKALRPNSLADYPGQERVKENLAVYIKAAKKREACLDHIILHGPPGLGKTTLAQIIAQELGVGFTASSGPCLDKPGDLAGILSSLAARTVLFVDEIHRLPIQVEEVFYTAMEDFSMDVLVGQGPGARSVTLDIAPFTLIGATTQLSKLSAPFLSRFGIQERLEFYTVASLAEILLQNAKLLGLQLSSAGAEALAARSRGTPRIAQRLLRRAWDFMDAREAQEIDAELVDYALGRLFIDSAGLDQTDRLILQTLAERFSGGPVGGDTLAITVGERRFVLEEVYEPFLIHQGFLERSPRGRLLTEKGRKHVMEFCC